MTKDGQDWSPCTFRCGMAFDHDNIYLSTEVDYISENFDEADYTRMSEYYKRGRNVWSCHDLNGWEVLSVCKSSNLAAGCSLSKDGDVEIMTIGGFQQEHIPTAGLGEGDEEGYGYVTRIREIGTHLYVCGSFGQVYKRSESGWIHMDAPFLPRRPRRGDLRESLRQEIRTAPMFEDINGPDEEDIYVCGMNGMLAHWDGQAWKVLRKLTDAHLNEIHVASRDEIWVCGGKGVVLHGNARDGFRLLVADIQGREFNSIHAFKGKVYLADHERLYTLEPGSGPGQMDARPLSIMFGLSPDLQDANMLDSAGGVLWSFGTKDLAYTEDGRHWTRLEHPDNPRIGTE